MVNIKVAIFFVAYLPQFVVLSEPHSTAEIGMQIFFLGLIFTFFVVIIFSAIGLLAGSLIHIIHFDIQQSLFLRWCFGSVYILIALKLLL
jgi:threonine/homoserine/homoserine lactone efflux protein